MLWSFLVRLVINIVALYVTASILPGFTVKDLNIETLFLIALVFGVINALVKPVVKLLTCPMVILTLGLFTLVINALMLLLTARLLGDATFHIESFWTALAGGIIMAIVAMVVESVLERIGLAGD